MRCIIELLFTMPREQASFNSSRIQRAYRMNNIEDTKLISRLQLLDKERVHQHRVTNQDIRLITITLDYIQSSSGKSPEGVAPAELQKAVEFRDDMQPCFMYGERTFSRRFGKSRRPKSAAAVGEKIPDIKLRRGSAGSSSSHSTEGSGGSGKSSTTQRPHSSTSYRQWAWKNDRFHTYRDKSGNSSSDEESSDKQNNSPERKSRTRKPRAQTAPISSQSRWAQPVASGWSDPMGAKPRPKTSGAIRGETATSTGRGRSGGYDDRLSKSDDENESRSPSDGRKVMSARGRSKRQPLHSRKSKLTNMVNQVRVMTTAAKSLRNTAKNPQNTSWMTSYTPASSRRQYEAKIAINQNRNNKLDVKVKDFMSKFPITKQVTLTRRSSVTSTT